MGDSSAAAAVSWSPGGGGLPAACGRTAEDVPGLQAPIPSATAVLRS